MIIKIANQDDMHHLSLLGQIATEELIPGHEFNFDEAFDSINLFEDSDLGVLFLALEGDKAMGCLCMVRIVTLINKERQLKDFHFYVLPEHRGSLVGLKLIKAAEDWAKKNKYDKISISLPSDKRGDFMKRLGYTDAHIVYEKEC